MSENDRKRVDGCAIFYRAIKWVSRVVPLLPTVKIYVLTIMITRTYIHPQQRVVYFFFIIYNMRTRIGIHYNILCSGCGHDSRRSLGACSAVNNRKRFSTHTILYESIAYYTRLFGIPNIGNECPRGDLLRPNVNVQRDIYSYCIAFVITVDENMR